SLHGGGAEAPGWGVAGHHASRLRICHLDGCNRTRYASGCRQSLAQPRGQLGDLLLETTIRALVDRKRNRTGRTWCYQADFMSQAIGIGFWESGESAGPERCLPSGTSTPGFGATETGAMATSRSSREVIYPGSCSSTASPATAPLVKRDSIEEVQRDHHLTVGGKQAISINGSHSFQVDGDVAEEFKADHSEQVALKYYLKGSSVVLEGVTGLTIKVGGSFVTLDSTGVQIVGSNALINSGGVALTG